MKISEAARRAIKLAAVEGGETFPAALDRLLGLEGNGMDSGHVPAGAGQAQKGAGTPVPRAPSAAEELAARIDAMPTEEEEPFVEQPLCYYPDEDECPHCGAGDPEDGDHHNMKTCRRHPEHPRYGRTK